jgi:hypothetical protein
MPRRILDRDEDLQLDLRQGHIRRQLRPVFGGPAIAFPGPRPDSRQAIVKVWGASPGTTGRHVRYLTHGKGTDGTDTTLFTAEEYTLTARPFIEQAHHDSHQYRLVVSFPNTGDLSLRRFVQAWMGQVSRDLRRPIDYVAAVHRDTAYTHVHVVLRGRDRDGHRLILPRRYLTHGLRYRAMVLATAWLGPVPEPERSTHAQLAREVEAAMDAQMREAKKEDGMADDATTWHPGDEALFVRRQSGEIHRVTIASEAIFDEEAPGNGLVYEVIKQEDLQRWRVLAEGLQPIVPYSALDRGDFDTPYDPETGTASVQAEYGDRPGDDLVETPAPVSQSLWENLMQRLDTLLHRSQDRVHDRDQGMGM